MADPTSGMETVGYKFAVEDEASKPIGNIEEAYISMMKSMESFHGQLAKSMKDSNDSMNEASDAADEAGEETKQTTGRFGELGVALSKDVLGLDRLGLSWEKIIRAMEVASVAAAAFIAIDFFQKVFAAARKFSQEIVTLNEVYAMTAKQTREVAGTILGLENRFGMTRQEVGGMVRSMLDIGLTPEVLKKAGTSFRSLAKDVQALTSATGMSSASAAEFASHMIHINRLPATAIRGIGNAIKTIADATKITSDELVNFTKSLDPILAVLSDKSDSARKDFISNMTGVAGALSDVGIDAGKATSQFANMLDRTSEEGTKALANLSLFTGQSTEALRTMIEENPAKVFDEVAKAAAGMPISELQLMGKALQPLGLDFVDLSKLRKVGQEHKDQADFFQKRAAESLKASQQDEALSEKAAKRQARIDAILRKFSKLWEDMLIRIGEPLIHALVPLLQDFVEPFIKDLTKLILSVDWKKFFTDFSKSLRVAWAVGKFVLGGLGKLFDFVGTTIAHMVSIGATLLEGFVEIISGNTDRAWTLFKDAFTNIREFAFEVLTFIPRLILKAFGVDLDEALNSARELFKEFWVYLKEKWEVIGAFLGGVWEGLKTNFRSATDNMYIALKDLWTKAENMFNSLGAIILAPFSLIADFIMEKVDKLLTWVGTEIAPKLEGIPFVGEDLVQALKGAGEAAQARIELRDKRRQAEQKASSVARTVKRGAAAGGPPAISTTTQMPNEMKTNSPEQEALMREQLAIQRETNELLRQSQTKVRMDPRLAFTFQQAGR